MNRNLTNYTIINMVNLLDKFSDKKFPQKISYAITRNIITLSKEYEVYSKSLNKLYASYNSYFIKDEDGKIMMNDNNIPMVIGDKQNEFNEELSNLLNIEVNVDVYTISNDSFNYDDENGRYDSMSAIDIINLQNILCDNCEENRKE